MNLKHIMVLLFTITLVSLSIPVKAYICDNAQFFEQCPTTDPMFAKIVNDFKIRKDGVLINAAALPCNPPISSLPISAYTDELTLLQALRTIYYMDLGKSNHLPWTSKTLYNWLKEKVGGFEISTTDQYDHWGGQMYSSTGDTANYYVIRAADDTTRKNRKKLTGIATMISLMMHERRHGDGNAFNHLTCCTAQVAGGPFACDKTYEETVNLGPYGIQYWLVKSWISGHINVGVGCMAASDKADAISFLRSDVNFRMNPASSNYCTNAPPVLTDANNQPGGCNCTGISGSSAGEPHIMTLDGLYYDFQAAGDFLLIENGPSFIVQVRQQKTPNQPNVAFNKAVAMQMGKSRVAVFLDPLRLVVNGKQTELTDGKTLSLPDNIKVSRNANTFVIESSRGETVSVVAVDNDWVNILGGNFLDVSVSLNYAAYGGMRGLLGNGNGDLQDDIATRDGQIINQPLSFEKFYYLYGASMSIGLEESLFNEVSLEKPTVVIVPKFEAPKKPYTVKDLSLKEYKLARAACVKADVKSEPLLDACTLDVAVLRSPKVAKLYTKVTAPFAVMKPGTGIRRVKNSRH